MHFSAMQNGKSFFDTYVQSPDQTTIVDIGAQDVNGSLREVAPVWPKYVGVDFANGKGVDIVIDDPYKLPFDSNSIDVAVSSSCFEHSKMFWLLFLDILRILKPSGLFYLNAPSNGCYHRYPVDCWRFYPDAGNALVEWGKYSGYEPVLLESFTSHQCRDRWNDFVAVFCKDAGFGHLYPNRIVAKHPGFDNALIDGSEQVINLEDAPEDMRMLKRARKLLPVVFK